MAGSNRTQTPSSQPAFDETRQEHNKLVDDFNYNMLNTSLISVGLAIGTTVTKVKSTVAASVIAGGVYSAQKAATDDEFTLGVAGSNTPVATGFVQKYMLLRDSANVATVQEGLQAATAAAVTWPTIPANKAIVGFITVTNTSGANFVPGATALNAAGIATVYTNGIEAAMLKAAKVNL